MAKTNEVVVYDNAASGHRKGYVETLSRAVSGVGFIGPRIKHIGLLLATPRLLLPTFEGGPKFNAALTMLRAVFGRKTAVILLRAHLVKHRSLPNRFSHWLTLTIFGRSRFIMPMSIVYSESLAERCPGIVFVEDPEFWDLSSETIDKAHSALADQVAALRRGRRILLVTGGLAASKGLNYLRQIFEAAPWLGEDILLVVAGKAAADAFDEVAALQTRDAFVCNKYLSDSELLSLFKLADMAWCCYPTERDMSSGIFGRCWQIGVVPIVREGALLVSKFEGQMPMLPIPVEDAKAAAEILRRDSTSRPARHLDWASQSHAFRYAIEQFFDQGQSR